LAPWSFINFSIKLPSFLKKSSVGGDGSLISMLFLDALSKQHHSLLT